MAEENTIVIAAGRPIDDFQELEELQGKYAGKLTIVKMELLQPDTIKVRPFGSCICCACQAG